MKKAKFNLFLFVVIISIFCSSAVAVDHIYAIDCYDSNEAISEFLLDTISTFQGAVNKDQPRLFVITDESDYHWLEDLNNNYGISYTMLDSPLDIFSEPNLTAYCYKYIVYDKDDCGLAINNAITLAGIVGGACIVDNNAVDLAMLQANGFTLHSHQHADMRGYWDDNEEAQLWGYNNLRDDCNDSICSVLRGTISGYRKGLDYTVQQNMFVWCVDSKPEVLSDYQTTQKAIMSTYEPNTIAYGRWMTEGKDVRALGEYGLIMVGHGPNVSIYSTLPEPESMQQKTSTRLVEYDANKTYIFVSFTQGGNLDFCQSEVFGYMTAVSATDPNYLVRERYPFGMFQSSVQGYLQPNVPQFFYDMMDPNQWFTSKGFGYTNPTTFEEFGLLDGWIEQARVHLAQMGHPDIMVNDNETEDDPSHDVIKKICQKLQPRSIVFKHQLNPGTDEDDDPEVFDGVPVFGDPVFGRKDEEKNLIIDDTVDAIVASAAKRQFFWVFWDHSTKILDTEKVLDDLTANYPDIVVLDPDQFIRLYLDTYVVGSGGDPNCYPTDDAYVKEAKPTNNYGSEEFLRQRDPSSDNETISYLKFNVSVSGTITSAKLKIKAAEAITDSTVYEVADTSWSESTVIYNTKPSVGSSIDTITSISSGQLCEFDVTDYVTANGTYSFAFNTSEDSARDFYSKDSAYPPVLTVTASMPQAPSKATSPSPANTATSVSVDATLSWTVDTEADTHDVYFGTDPTPDAYEFKVSQSGTTYDPGTLANNTTYYWRIDEKNEHGTTTGEVWNFSTEDNSPVTEQFGPTDDTYVKEAKPNGNNGSNDVLRVRGPGSSMLVYSYLKFAVSGLNGTVTSAKLKIRTGAESIDDTSAYAVTGTWDEDTLAWNNDALSWGDLLDSKTNLSPSTWYEFDVSDEVDADGTYTFGLKTTQDNAGLDWSSKESAYAPVLEVIYQP